MNNFSSVSQNHDYNQDRNPFSRRVLFLHAFDTLSSTRNHIQNHDLSEDYLPEIREQDHCRLMMDKLSQIKEESESSEYSVSGTLKQLFGANKQTILMISLMSIGSALFQLGGLILLQVIVDEVTKEFPLNYAKVYWLVFGIGLMWLMKSIFYNNLIYESAILPVRFKNALILLVFEKIISLTQTSINKQEIGRIINFISSDFGSIEKRLSFLSISLSFPIKIIGIWAILFTRLGWMCFILLILTLLIVGFQVLMGKLSAKYMKQVNVSKDKRIKMYTEIIEGMKIIKMYGWEMAFKNLIQKVREKQIDSYLKCKLVKSVMKITKQVFIYFSAFICFWIIFQFGNPEANLSSAKIVAALHPILILNDAIVCFGNTFTMYFSFEVVLERFSIIMNTKENRLQQIGFIEDDEKQTYIEKGEVKFVNFCGFWKKGQENEQSVPVLKNINLHFKSKGFYGIMGKVGCGKSSILASILSEMPFCSGSVLKKGSIAYVEQEAVVFTTTIKENILFGQQFDQQRYEKVVKCCCLDEDLLIWEKGDATVVGERGLTLSGGQKARLTLARALYSDSDIYLLDDPLSAVDAKVGRKMLEKLCEYLVGRKTVILVTHQTHFLEGCDQIILIEDGEATSIINGKGIESIMIDEKMESEMKMQENQTQQKLPVKPQQSVQVRWGSYPKYIFYNNLNYFIFPTALLFFISYEVIMSFIIRIYSMYDSVKKGQNQTFENFSSFWLVLFVLHLLAFVCFVLKIFVLQVAMLKSNAKIHEDMVLAMIQSPLSFFDTTPTAQLTNRFTSDLSILDNDIGDSFSAIIGRSILWIVMLGSIIQINKLYIAPSVICFIFFFLIVKYSKQTIISIKQLSLKLKSPILHHLRQMMAGLIPIQTLRQQNRFIRGFEQFLNTSLRGNIAYITVQRAFSVGSYYITIIILVLGMEVGVTQINKDNALLYGVQIVYVIRLLNSVQYLLRQFIQIQSLMISAERTIKITLLSPEQQINPVEQYQFQSSTNIMPDSTNIQVKNLSLRYRPQLPLILSSISFQIQEGEKIGIVGRTGAGKSSIIQALFRTVQPQEGWQYRIGQHDGTKMSLYTLRMYMSVIPQNPFLFRGTIAENLDPFGIEPEKHLWNALSRADLQNYVVSLPERLNTNVNNNSDLFSVGQKQLLCLARALINRRKILVLDEATSNVDKQTDDFIQKCIRNEFKSSTVITIAHRLSTIADYDKIIVMSQGRIVQRGSPYELLKRNGLFNEMLSQGGQEGKIIKQMIIRKKK